MSRETYRVTFQPEGSSAFVLADTTLVEAAGQAGIILNTPCGGQGTCGKCVVQVKGEAPPPTSSERNRFSEGELQEGYRLACQMQVGADLVVSVPEETRFFEQVVLTEGREHGIQVQPEVRKQFVELSEPDGEDLRSDLDRLRDALGEEGRKLRVDLSLARRLPELLREADFGITIVRDGGEVISLEPGDTTGGTWGVAVDIGTTTVVGNLSDIASGDRVATASRTNPQVHFGDDVVGRIQYADEHDAGLQQLHQKLIGCINEITLELADEAGVELNDIYEITVVGNPTMTHTFLGLSPSSIAQAPYVPAVREAFDVRAEELGLDIRPRAHVHVLPNISGYVGSDTVAVALGSRLAHSEEVLLAVDIGTNGEVIMGNRDRLVSCSCDAGPAFEGARIRYGMRGAEGAISKVVINDSIETAVIGGGRARGICGSGLLDAVAELLRVEVINPAGRILEGDALPDDLSPGVRQALTTVEDEPAVILVDERHSKTQGAILLTQRDVRELQLAKAAIWAGIQVVCGEFDMAPAEVSRILLAGGFGNFIRRSSAQRIGLLPPMPAERIEFIGNAALVGARLALMCSDCRQEARNISENTEYIELANRTEFQMFYAEAMMFPSSNEFGNATD
jgi:uncharacterized 2Fe-2S/4Fe-4S cluster protein (DUF4445 family)